MQEYTKPHTQYSSPPSTQHRGEGGKGSEGRGQGDGWGDRAQEGRRNDDRPEARFDGERRDIKESAQRAHDRLDDAGSEVRQRLEKAAADGRTRLCHELRSIGEAAESAADSLKEEDQDRLGGYVRGIRRQCERAAGYLEDRSVQSLTSDIGHVARRNPALFVGSAVALGLAAGRFLSARPPQEGHDSRTGGQPRGGQPGGSQPWGSRPGDAGDDRREPGHPEDRGGAAYQSGSSVGASGAAPVTPGRSATSTTSTTMDSRQRNDSAD